MNLKVSILLIMIILVFFPLLFYIFTFFLTRSKVLSDESLPDSEYALVLGAGLKKDGMPTELLRDRVITSIRALRSEKIKRILFSGSINHKGFSEPMAMKKIAESQGVNLNQVILDDKGNSTFDSCVNFLFSNYPQPVILVTQPFHLPRSLLICQLLGFAAYGLPAKEINYSRLDQIWWHLREAYAIPYNFLKIGRFFFGR